MKTRDEDIRPNIVLDDEKAILLDHNYDGIEELNNPLPGWWLTIFYTTIVFAVLYVGYYEFAGGPSLKQELEKDLAEVQEHQPKAQDPGQFEQRLMAALNRPEEIAEGKKIYTAKCVACHGAAGEGGIGPNLTDNFWIHGDGKPPAIAATVNVGVADKGMPPWGGIGDQGVLKEAELIEVTAFVASLRGTNPANGKAPQGEDRGAPTP